MAVTSNRGRGLVAQRPGANPQLEFQYYQRKRNQHRAGDFLCLCKFDIDSQCGEKTGHVLYLFINVFSTEIGTLNYNYFNISST